MTTSLNREDVRRLAHEPLGKGKMRHRINLLGVGGVGSNLLRQALRNSARERFMFRCYDDDCVVNSVFPLQANMTNCIFFGSRRDEIIVQDAFERSQPEFFALNMSHCLVKVDELLTRTLDAMRVVEPLVAEQEAKEAK